MLKRLLVVLAFTFLVSSGYFMYANHRSSDNQAKTIEATDLRGEDVTLDLGKLKTYVGSHIYAGTTVVLAGSYARAQAAASASATAGQTSALVYADAQKTCSGKNDSIVQARCNAQYLSDHLSSVPSATPVPIPQPSDYQYKFISPLWAPDMAGVLLLASALMGIWWLVLVVQKRRQS